MDSLNFGQYLESVARRVPDKTALIYDNRSYTYRQFLDRVRQLAAALKKAGIQKQDRVGMLCHNCTEYLEVVYACAMVGAVCVQYNWRLAPLEIVDLVYRSQPKLIFFSQHYETCYQGVKPACPPEIRWISVDGNLENAQTYEDFFDSAQAGEMQWEGGGEDIFLEIYTSGTTGTPKGVMLSHRAVLAHAFANIFDCRWKADDVYLTILPLFHASSSGTYATLMCGATVIIRERFEEKDYLEYLQTHRATRLSLTPTMLKALLRSGLLPQYDLSCVKYIVYGAAPVTPKVLRECMKYFHCQFYQLYGMTEMSPTVAVLRPEDHIPDGTDAELNLLRSVGRPATGVLVKIIDTEGKECPTGVAGEVVVYGDGMMTGYQGMPEKTAAVLADGWYHSSDVGYLDENGYLFITGRLNDVIISGEENICAKEVEDCIRLLEDDVLDAAVVGLPDERWGEIVAAAIVRQPGSKLTAEQVVAHCKATIASYKKPRRVMFVDALPLNSCGKVISKELKAMFQAEKT